MKSLRILRLITFISLICICALPLVAQAPYRLTDLSNHPYNPGAMGVTAFGDSVYFTGEDYVGGTGSQLWRSDGNPDSSGIVRRFMATTSSMERGVSAGNRFFFVNGGWSELWVTDGTEAGTRLLESIPNGSINRMAAVGSRLFFSMDDGVSGTELWVSDGTEAGTQLVKDINPGSADSTPAFIVEFQGKAYFGAYEPSSGYELWRSDGTEAGTQLVIDIMPGSSGYASSLTVVGSSLFFTAETSAAGSELWVSDGTAAGTRLVKDIRPGGSGSGSYGLKAAGTKLYFYANNGVTGSEPWISDGTTAGTILLSDINPGSASSYASGFADRGDGTILFPANDGVHGYEIWKTDGSIGGTAMVVDAAPGTNGSVSEWRGICSFGKCYYEGYDAAPNGELWVTDGTPAGTHMVVDLEPGSAGAGADYLALVGNRLFFNAWTSAQGRELWALETCTATDAPASLIATGSVNAIQLSWAAVSAGVDHYSVHRALGHAQGGVFEKLANVPSSETWFTDGTIATGRTYSYKVVAVTAAGCESRFSNTVDAVAGCALVDGRIAVDGDVTICPSQTGASLMLYDNGGIDATRQWGYRLVPGGAITPFPGETGTRYTLSGGQFPAAGSYSIVCTRTLPCGAELVTEEASVTIDPDSIEPVIFTSAQSACVGGVISAGVGSSYASVDWQVTGGTIVYYGPYGSIDIAPDGSGPVTIEVGVEEGPSCRGSSSVVIPLVALPPPVLLSPNTEICASSEGSVGVQYDPTLAAYAWSIENGTITNQSQYGDSVMFQAGTTGPVQISVTVTNNNGCSSSNTVEIPIKTIPPPVLLSPNTEICASSEGSVGVQYDPTLAAYAWSIENGTITNQSQYGDSVMFRAGTTGPVRVSVTVTSNDGCTATSSIEIPLKTIPPPVIDAYFSAVCASSHTPAWIAPYPIAASYQWAIENGTITSPTTTEPNVMYIAGESGVVRLTVTVTTTDGCVATSTRDFTINPLPVAAITPIGATTFCEGGSVVLTASGGTGYNWSTGATTQSITVAESGSYTVRAINENGCDSTSAETTVTVIPLPVATITPDGATTFCEGGSVVLTASAGASYFWSNGATTPSITATQSANYSVTVTNASGCSSTSAATAVTVNPAPAATITPSGATTFCEGGSVVLTSSVGASYIWSNGATTQSITAMQSGDYGVTVTNASGCSTASTMISVTVNSLPDATVTPSGAASFCPGGSVVLTATAGGSSYLWSNGATTPSITVSQPGSYSVTVTGYSGCTTTSAPTVVTENPAITATVASSVAPAADGHIHVCEGTTVLLTASVTGGSGEGYTFQWYSIAGAPIPGATASTYLVTQPNYYFVRATDSAGCTSQSNVPVIEWDPNRSSDFTVPTNACSTSIGSVTATETEGQFLWSITNGTLLSDPTLASVTYQVGESGTTTLTLTRPEACGSTTSKTIAIDAIPGGAVTPNGPTTFCQGGSVILTASAGASYAWSNGATTPSITVTESGWYSVIVTNAQGCSTSSAPTQVTVNPLPMASVSGGGNVCAGGSATVQATLTGSAPWSITWSDGFVQNGIATSVVTRSVSPSTKTSYSVTSVADASCSGSSSGSAIVTVTPLPTAAVSGNATICNGSQATISVSLTGAAPWTLTWSDGLVQSGITTSSSTRTVSPTTTTTYSVTAVSGASCAGSASGSATITVNQKPTITTQPVSKSIKKNMTTTLSVVATGTGTLSYQWYKGASGVTTTPVGTNSPSYTTPRILKQTQYWVKVTNSCGSTNSATATISIR